MKKIDVIIQARLGSTRFPRKVLYNIKNKSIIHYLIDRLLLSKKINRIIVAIPNEKNNDLYDHLYKTDIKIFKGSEKNVLSRFYLAAKFYKCKNIIRITGDCPLVDPKMIDKMIDIFFKKNLDYLSNTMPPKFPDGLDIEIFKMSALQYTHINDFSNSLAKEHVTYTMRNNKKFKIDNFYIANEDYSEFRLTLDEREDIQKIKKIILYFYPKINFDWNNIKNYINKNKNFFENKINIQRNEGIYLNTGQKLWKRAQNKILGGNMLLSKRPNLYLPNFWPTYYTKAKGCYIWDLDKKKYTDMSMMGVGTNILGYGYKYVDEAVLKAVKDGNMSTFNTPDEVYLAEKLLDLNPWASKVKFARSGGEANSIAIRIARTFSKNENIAFCGYHGWHDWYLAANLNGAKNLNNHLLPNLKSKGISTKLKNSIFPFEYNNIDKFKKLIVDKKIGIVMMEVTRNVKPNNNFLKNVRKITKENNIVLIFDECSSGFRENFGGIHKKLKINPDMAMFGKALGNGYAINAVVGSKRIMQAANNSFISSTFWSERVGFAAGIATLESMKKIKSWEQITKIGAKIEKKWISIAKKYNVKIDTGGLKPLINFKIESDDWLKYKTYLTQEMLKKNILATNIVYTSISHNQTVLDKYFYYFERIIKDISEFEDGKRIDSYIDGPIAFAGLKRSN